jgi:hypothetical protein
VRPTGDRTGAVTVVRRLGVTAGTEVAVVVGAGIVVVVVGPAGLVVGRLLVGGRPAWSGWASSNTPVADSAKSPVAVTANAATRNTAQTGRVTSTRRR